MAPINGMGVVGRVKVVPECYRWQYGYLQAYKGRIICGTFKWHGGSVEGKGVPRVFKRALGQNRVKGALDMCTI